MTIKAVLFDIDGTLVDSNEAHVSAWQRAFAEVGMQVGRQTIHAQIGKGSDMLVPALMPHAKEETRQRVSEGHSTIYQGEYLGKVVPFAHARDMLARVHASGRQVVLASSAAEKELEYYLDLLDARDLVVASTSAADVAHTKPAPDIFAAALAKLANVAPGEAIVVGDTPYDIEAAKGCGIAAVAVRSGRFSDAVLAQAGAVTIYDDVAAILAAFESSPLAR